MPTLLLHTLWKLQDGGHSARHGDATISVKNAQYLLWILHGQAGPFSGIMSSEQEGNANVAVGAGEGSTLGQPFWGGHNHSC